MEDKKNKMNYQKRNGTKGVKLSRHLAKKGSQKTSGLSQQKLASLTQ